MGFQMEERIHKFLHSSQDQEMHPPSSSPGHRLSMDAWTDNILHDTPQNSSQWLQILDFRSWYLK